MKILIGFIVLLISTVSCNKYLDKKASESLAVPQSPEDLQAILDNNSFLNFQLGTALIEVIADDYYVKDDRYNSAPGDVKGAYVWDDVHNQFLPGWSNPYQAVYNVNVVFDNLDRIRPNSTTEQLNQIEGAALFFRSLAFFNLLQLYSKPYSNVSQDSPGIILKLTGSVTENIAVRATVKEGYNQIINDLKKSSELLPSRSPYIMRPSGIAANALLARVYLSMSDYDNAYKYADKVKNTFSDLIDFNDLVPSNTPALPPFLSNSEILFFNVLRSATFTDAAYNIIDSNLYNSYEEVDIRKKAFFTTSVSGGPGTFRFKGSYYNNSNGTIFNGLTTSEIYLILAECLARKGQAEESLSYLNKLLRKRYLKDEFSDYSISDPSEVLNLILKERRKELVFRGLRWSDIRRFNLEGRSLELVRKVNNQVIILPPNDLKSTLLIPNLEITRSGITQNPR